MSSITTKSKELQLQKAVKDSQQVIQKWAKHFQSSSERIPTSLVSVDNGLQEKRLFVMKKHCTEKEIGAVLMLQIKSLNDFLNLSKKMSADQIAETARLILDSYDDMSFTAIQDCFTRIKMAKAPFDDKMYESIDGRKIFQFLDTYRMYQTEHLEHKHKLEQSKPLEIPDTVTATAMSKIANKLHVEYHLNKARKAAVDKSELDEMIHGWINDFNKLQMDHPNDIKFNYPGAIDDYVNNQMSKYLQTQNK